MVVYVDLAFAVNFGVDACLLLLTVTLLRSKPKLWRIGAAAAAGSVYAVATLFPGTAWLDFGIVKLFVSFAMVLIAACENASCLRGARGLLQLAKRVALFYGVTFASGGALIALRSLAGENASALGSLTMVSGRVVWWTSLQTMSFLFLFPIALYLVRYAYRFSARSRELGAFSVLTRWEVDGRVVEVNAFIDTGNSLLDPATRTPVAVMHAHAVRAFLPEPLWDLLAEAGDPFAKLYQAAEGLGDFASRIRIIPYQSVGGKRGYLFAVRPDSATLVKGTEEHSLMPIYMALQPETVSKNGEFACLLPAAIAFPLLGREESHGRSASPTGETVRPSHSA